MDIKWKAEGGAGMPAECASIVVEYMTAPILHKVLLSDTDQSLATVPSGMFNKFDSNTFFPGGMQEVMTCPY
jgi:hypothetical protein